MAGLESELRARALDQCELCKAQGALHTHHIAPYTDQVLEHSALLCQTCTNQILGNEELDSKHWSCLNEAIWSEHSPIQVLSWRILHRLQDIWAKELLEQAYLAEDTLEWAKSGMAESEDAGAPTFDSNGTPLHTGDSVTLIKDLDVKGTSFVAKRGTLVKEIRLTDNPEHVDGKVNGITIVLKTQFLKKASQ